MSIDEIIEENKFEKQEKLNYFDSGHIATHAIFFGLEGVGGFISTLAVSNIAAPGIGIAIGAGILLHLGICFIKYKVNQKKEKKKLIQSIFNYSTNFTDNINVFQKNILNKIETLKTNVINQINDIYLSETLKLDENEELKFKNILKLFEDNLINNFKFK